MPTNEPSINVSAFAGLRNTARPATLPDGALTLARNINIDNAGRIETRRGYVDVPGLSGITAMYSPRNGEALYVVAGGQLKRVLSVQPLITDLIAEGISSARVWWAEAGSRVFTNGAFRAILNGSEIAGYPAPPELGEKSGEFDAVGAYSTAHGAILSPMPVNATAICYRAGRLWAAEYDSANDQSAIWYSQPFHWGSFDLYRDYILVPGRALMLADGGAGLVIGTDRAIWAYGEAMVQVADYGAVDCQPVYDGARTYFWTQDGLCRGLPFENVTGELYSVPPGDRAALGLVTDDGCDRVLVSIHGGGQAPRAY